MGLDVSPFKMSSQTYPQFDSVMPWPLTYIHPCLHPTHCAIMRLEQATLSICMTYQMVDKVNQLISLKGILILHILTFILILY